MSDNSGLPQVTLKFNPPGPRFAISEDATMPVITVTAHLSNVASALQPSPNYTWRAELSFDGASTPHGAACRNSHVTMAPVTRTNNTFVVPFSEVRGGALKISVCVQVGSRTLMATSTGLEIVGTNPSIGRLVAHCSPCVAFRKLLRHESQLQQFSGKMSHPLFSGDGLGGVGLCQITKPKPTADDVWNWKTNLSTGWNLFVQKREAARSYPAQVRESAEFKTLVARYNDAHPSASAQSAGLYRAPRPAPLLPDTAERSFAEVSVLTPPPGASSPSPLRRTIAIGLADFTEEQLNRDTLRGFNGYAGQTHEYRVQLDADGMLVVKESPDGRSGMAQWERVSAEERLRIYDRKGIGKNHRGDPDYVVHVENKAMF